MKCPICSSKTKVFNARQKERTYRRRECLSCGERFTTYEITVPIILDVLDGYLPQSEVDYIAHVLELEFPSNDQKGQHLRKHG